MQDMASFARVSRVGLVALTLLVVAGTGLAQPPRAGVVTAVHGTATVSRGAITMPLALKFRDDVFAQDRIATGELSYARILLGGAAVVSVRERSAVTISETSQVSSISVGSGGIALSVARELMRPGQAIEIRTLNAVAGIRGTVIVTEVAGATTRFTLLTGKVDVRAAGTTVSLLPRQAVSIVGATVPGPIQRVTPDEATEVARRFQMPMASAPGRGSEWIASEHVRRAAIAARQHREPLAEAARDGSGGRGRKWDADDDDAVAPSLPSKRSGGHGAALSAPPKLAPPTPSLPVTVDAASSTGKHGKKVD
jgi:hypothetical protein